MFSINRDLLKTKLIATGVHLSLSLVVFAYLAYLIFYHWFPQPYFSVDGGWQGIRLVAAVDLVLGPLITFLIFDLTKSRRAIVFDLVIILVIQFGALAYGVVTTYQQRTLAIVVISEFILSAAESNYAGTLESPEQLRQYSHETPPIIFSDLPLTAEGLEEAKRIKIETGVSEHAQMQHYRSAKALKPALEARQQGFRDFLQESEARDQFEGWLDRNQKTADEVMIGYFSGRYGTAWLVFDRQARYLGYFW